MHHASNDQYLDKNYGDVLIIWDKLFGTFVEEKEKAVFGLTKPLESYSFLWQHFHFLLEIIYSVKNTNGFNSKLKIIFGKPGNIKPEARKVLEKIYLSRDKAAATTNRFKNYVAAQMSIILMALFLFLLFEKHLSLATQIGAALFIIVTLINCGALLEQRKWVFYLEYLRFSIIFTLLYIYFPYHSTIAIILTFGILQYIFFHHYETGICQ